mgnify:CR=1 FL=1
MAGYIGSKSSVTLVDGYNEAEADAEFVTKTGDSMTGNLSLGDNNKAIFGAGSDLQIYHSGSHSVIKDAGDGNLQLIANDFQLRNGADNANMMTGANGGAITLMHNGSSKLATTSTGVDVTGTVTSDGLTVSTSASGFASQITNNNDSSQGLQVRTSDNDGGQFILDLQSSSSSTGTDYASKFLVTKNGNVGIGGTPDSGRKLHIEGGDATVGITLKDTAGGQFGINSDGGSLIFKSDTAGAERMRLDSSGNLHIGRTSTGAVGNGHTIRGGDSAVFSRDAAGETVQVCRRNDQGDLIQFRRGGSVCGEIVNTGGSTVAYNTSSDYRLKENVVDLTGASARVNQLDVKRFNFIADGTDTVVDGFLAHEVATVVPEAITGTKDAMRDEEYEVTPAVLDDDGNVTTEAVMGTRSVPDYQGIDQSKLVPLLTAALQEALTEIASLKTRVEALEA